MMNIRRFLILAGVIFILFLSIGSVNAQQPEPPRSYLFVEVRDATGQAIGDATVRVSNADGKELLNAKTNKEGTLQKSFHQDLPVVTHHLDLQITKPGYLSYEQVIFLEFPQFGGLTEDLPGSGEPVDYAKGPPMKIALLKTAVTSAERRAVAVEDQKRLLLLAVKRRDAASVRKLLQKGAKAITTDNKRVPAIAWAAFAGDPETIKVLLRAGAVVRSTNSLAREALLIYLAEGIARARFPNKGESVAENDWPTLQADIVHRLIEAGVDVNANDPYRGTVLNQAIFHFMRPESAELSLETIKELIAAKANVNAADKSGLTPLMLASYGSEELMKLLLEAGAKTSINAKDKSGRTALINAAVAYRYSSSANLRVLIANGAKVNEADDAGETALMLAAGAALIHMVQTLIRGGASVNVKDKQGQTALIYAVTGSGQSTLDGTRTVRALLAAGANINDVDNNGRSALMYARSLELFQTLIDAGANVNLVDTNGQTALMLTAKNYALGFFYLQKSAGMLLQKGAGAFINTKDKQGQTALLLALSGSGWEEPDMLKVLLAAGANVNDANKDGQTPLIRAAQKSNVAGVKMLLEAHASLNLRDKTGRTALMWAAVGGEAWGGDGRAFEIVTALLKGGASVNDVDSYGETPLMLAAMIGSVDAIRTLLAAHASVNAKDSVGRTALMHAVLQGNAESVKLLLKSGADVDIRDNQGETALTIASRTETIELLKAATRP